MVKVHGSLRAKKLRVVMAMLRAAPTLGIFAPPMSPPHRCHELTGNRQGQLTVDLDHPYRLGFQPNHDPLPKRVEGGLDWKQVPCGNLCVPPQRIHLRTKFASEPGTNASARRGPKRSISANGA